MPAFFYLADKLNYRVAICCFGISNIDFSGMQRK